MINILQSIIKILKFSLSAFAKKKKQNNCLQTISFHLFLVIFNRKTGIWKSLGFLSIAWKLI